MMFGIMFLDTDEEVTGVRTVDEEIGHPFK
jgi:hypothetical protein